MQEFFFAKFSKYVINTAVHNLFFLNKNILYNIHTSVGIDIQDRTCKKSPNYDRKTRKIKLLGHPAKKVIFFSGPTTKIRFRLF